MLHPVTASSVLDLRFEPVAQYRPFAIVAPGFAQVEQPAGEPVTGLHRSDARPVAPFAAVDAEVVRLRGQVALGLVGAADQDVLAVYDSRRRRLSIRVRRGGTTHTVARRTVSLKAPFRLAFVLCENQVTVLADSGTGGWQALLTERDGVSGLIDLRDPATLAEYSYGWGAVREGDAVRLGRVQAGPFGYAGLRDLHLVQHVDGRPYVRDGRLYLSATAAGMGFFHAAHFGVFTLDLADPTALEQVAQVYFRRDGLLLGDHAGQIVVDEDTDTCLVGVSAWGDFGRPGGRVHARQSTSSPDVLSGVHVLDSAPLALPTEFGAWDPGFTKIDDRWYVAFVESPTQGDPFDFRPALAVGPSGGGPFDALTLVGSDTDLEQCEGPILQRVAGEWYLLASDGRHRAYRVYDLAMRFKGTLDAPYGSNIPHPQLVRLPDGGWWMVTFNGTQFAEKRLGYGGHGDVIILHAAGS